MKSTLCPKAFQQSGNEQVRQFAPHRCCTSWETLHFREAASNAPIQSPKSQAGLKHLPPERIVAAVSYKAFHEQYRQVAAAAATSIGIQ